ncbi:pyridoxamine 5'-phosphate oxidase family protein [Oxalobacteraceae bacterium OM1]|nr:pyridoxamine 5'-phosphate oxidase family protein [Oxalobacteraceae bacterium OM1]
MNDAAFYHQGSRQVQEQFGTCSLADRVLKNLVRDKLNDDDRAFIESRSFFFLATADADGCPDCSYKGGSPGFVRVVDACTLAFPNYDGNGMFRSLGNVVTNPHVGLLFIDFELAIRLRVNGRATLHADDPLLSDFVGAQLIVRVHLDAVFPNCTRYVHRMIMVQESAFVPRKEHKPLNAKGRQSEVARDLHLHDESHAPLESDTWRRRANRRLRIWVKRQIVTTLARMRP